jgi:hypothetical protein
MCVVEQEGPISFQVLARRVLSVWGMGRIGGRIEARFVALCARSSLTVTKDGLMKYYWPPNLSPESYRAFRVPGGTPATKRGADEIAPEEIANAAEQVLAASISLPMEDLVSETARLLGFARLGVTVQSCVTNGVKRLVASKRATDQNGQIVLPNS